MIENRMENSNSRTIFQIISHLTLYMPRVELRDLQLVLKAFHFLALYFETIVNAF